MAIIELNKEEVLRLVGKRISDQELRERIPMLGVGLERLTKDTLTVEILPNRPDMLSEPGFARALRSFLGVKTGLQNYTVTKSTYNVIVDTNLKQVRPYTACCVVKKLRLDERKLADIINLQEKLHGTFCRNRKKAAIGIYPMEHIQWPITFEARKPSEIFFRPLDSEESLSAPEILSLHSKGQQYKHLLEGLRMYSVFVDASGKILSMPPVINSEEVGRVTTKTKDVFVEVSGFDLGYLKLCLNILATALADLGGTLYAVDVVYTPQHIPLPDLRPRLMKLNLRYVENILGVSVSKQQATKLLSKMGYGFKHNNVFVPSYRADVLHPVDVIEDLAIAYGYEKFVPEIPNLATVGKENAFSVFLSKLATLFVGLGVIEVSTYHLTKKELQQRFVSSVVQIENSVSEEYQVLRGALLPGLLHVLQSNKHHEYPQKIFELGTVFLNTEREHLSVALSHAHVSFTEIKQLADALFRSFSLSLTYKEAEKGFFISGRAAVVSCKGRTLGYVGEVHPGILEQFGLEMPVAALELDIRNLFALLQ